MAKGKDAEEMALLANVCFDGLGPLQVAARMGRLDVIRYMVEELNFDVNHGSAQFGMCALPYLWVKVCSSDVSMSL